MANPKKKGKTTPPQNHPETPDNPARTRKTLHTPRGKTKSSLIRADIVLRTCGSSLVAWCPHHLWGCWQMTRVIAVAVGTPHHVVGSTDNGPTPRRSKVVCPTTCGLFPIRLVLPISLSDAHMLTNPMPNRLYVPGTALHPGERRNPLHVNSHRRIALHRPACHTPASLVRTLSLCRTVLTAVVLPASSLLPCAQPSRPGAAPNPQRPTQNVSR